MYRHLTILIFPLFLLVSLSRALKADSDDLQNLRLTTSLIAYGFKAYYKDSEEVGTFQEPYYWWESGVAWGSLLDYWYYMGDDSYVSTVQDALLAQVGANRDYVPESQNMTEGNDDQVFWGAAVMAAAERGFPNPKDDESLQWLALANATFHSMASRWDTANCAGGLRWQIYDWNNGYDYKNAVSNGGLFHLASRLARFTKDDGYVDWCEKVWDWMEDVKFISPQENGHLMVYDGASIDGNCTNVTELQWSYNAGLLLSGTAYLANHTNSDKWKDRNQNLLGGLGVFFNEDDVMWEPACQNNYKCNNDQRCFKGILSRFLGLTAQLLNDTQDTIDTYLKASAKAAASCCDGGKDGVTCGMDWRVGTYDDYYGLGEQINALETIQNLRWKDTDPPGTQDST